MHACHCYVECHQKIFKAFRRNSADWEVLGRKLKVSESFLEELKTDVQITEETKGWRK